MSSPAPGWYPDPGNPALGRWWDGTQWTSATQWATILQSQAVGKPRRPADDNFFRLAGVLQLLLAVTVAADIVIVSGDVFILGVADQFIAGTPDIDDATLSDQINVVAFWEFLIMTLVTGVVFIRWLFLAHSSDRVNPHSQRQRSGWAVGGWFVPVLNVWRPLEIVVDVRRGIEGPTARATVVMWLWWLTLLAAVTARYVTGRLWGAAASDVMSEFGEQLRLAALSDIVTYVLDIVAAVLAILVVRSVTSMLRAAPVVS